VTAKIHRDDAVRQAQRSEESAGYPRRSDAEDETVQQDHGLAFSRHRVMNVYAVGIEIAPLFTHALVPADHRRSRIDGGAELAE
jgi:hypothetical protein